MSKATLNPKIKTFLHEGTVIPAHPLALDAERKLNEKRQRALTRYYMACETGGIAVGVHTTQFEIRDPGVNLYAPVLELAADEVAAASLSRASRFADFHSGSPSLRQKQFRDQRGNCSPGYHLP